MVRSRSTVALAAVASTVLGCVFGTTLSGVTFVLNADANMDWSGVWLLPLYGLGYSMVVGAPSMLIFGLPIHALLTRLNRRGVGSYLAAGAVGGSLTVGAVFLIAFASFAGTYERALTDMQGVIPLGVTIGICVATIFWLIRRPDRNPPNPPTRAP